jgi:putative DNA primase/helicase
MNPLTQTPLTNLQTRFAILDLNGETRIVDREQINFRGNDEVFYYKKTDAELHMSRELELMPVSNPKQIIKDFWINPDTHVYKKIAFHPDEKSPTTLNYWRGNTVLPAKGNWSCIQEFLFEVICASDRLTNEYLIYFLAHMLQKPEEKPLIEFDEEDENLLNSKAAAGPVQSKKKEMPDEEEDSDINQV